MEHLRINGVGRDLSCDNVILVYTNKCLTDGELRVVHDLLTDHFNIRGMTDEVLWPPVTPTRL